MGAYFCMDAYEHDVVVAIKMGAYIHGVLIIPILRYFNKMLEYHIGVGLWRYGVGSHTCRLQAVCT